MFEARKTTPIPTGDRGEAPAGAARPGVPGLPADWTRLRVQWGLIALVVVLSVGLDAATRAGGRPGMGPCSEADSEGMPTPRHRTSPAPRAAGGMMKCLTARCDSHNTAPGRGSG